MSFWENNAKNNSGSYGTGSSSGFVNSWDSNSSIMKAVGGSSGGKMSPWGSNSSNLGNPAGSSFGSGSSGFNKAWDTYCGSGTGGGSSSKW